MRGPTRFVRHGFLEASVQIVDFASLLTLG